MEIDLKRYDQISEIEESLETLLKYANLSQYNLCILNYENQILLILTIITILYKQHTHNEYLINRIKQISVEQTLKITKENYIIEDIIEELDEVIEEKNIKKAQIVLETKGKIIHNQLKKYFKNKSKNYILENMPLQILVEQNQIMELIELNPFAINQCMNFKSLNKTEKTFYNIIEYYNLIETEDYIKLKELIIKNSDKKDIKKIIILILVNVYQEILDDKNESNIEIKALIENNKIRNDHIIELFIRNNEFSNKYLEYFILYNIGIKRGRLEELSRKSSYEYVKKRGCTY